jgi:homoserine kinase type II
MAVYTHLTLEEITAFVAPYALGDLYAAHPIAEGIENTNYLLEFKKSIFTAQGAARSVGFGAGPPQRTQCNMTTKAILTLFEKRVRAEDLPFYMDFMSHLSVRGINCPHPYGTIRELAGRPAVLISFLQGTGNAESTPATLSALGVEMARMHLGVQDFTPSRPNDFAPHRLAPLYEKTTAHLDGLRAGLCAEIAEEIKLMQCWPSLNLPQGVIHADLFRDNVFFKNTLITQQPDQVGGGEAVGFGAVAPRLTGIIDFYFSATDYFAYDLAIVINAWDCHLHGTDALLQGYETLRPLSDAERKALPFLARGAALRFLMTRAHDWFFRVEGAVVTPKDPLEYLEKWEYWKGLS